MGSSKSGCGSVAAGEEGSGTHSPRGTLTARQLAPGTTKKSSSLILSHPSYNEYAPAECSQEPRWLGNGSVAVISQCMMVPRFYPQCCTFESSVKLF